MCERKGAIHCGKEPDEEVNPAEKRKEEERHDEPDRAEKVPIQETICPMKETDILIKPNDRLSFRIDVFSVGCERLVVTHDEESVEQFRDRGGKSCIDNEYRSGRCVRSYRKRYEHQPVLDIVAHRFDVPRPDFWAVFEQACKLSIAAVKENGDINKYNASEG